MAQAVPNLCCSRKTFLNESLIKSNLPWWNIWFADNPVQVFNEHLLLLVGCFVPTKVIRVRHKDKPWFDDKFRHALASSRRLIFGGPVITLGKSLFAVK